jgi:hypothetical protein
VANRIMEQLQTRKSWCSNIAGVRRQLTRARYSPCHTFRIWIVILICVYDICSHFSHLNLWEGSSTSSCSMTRCNSNFIFSTVYRSVFTYAAEIDQEPIINIDESETKFLSRSSRARELQKTTIPESKLTINQILYNAGKRGLGGGIPGAIAGVVQVVSLMWVRTIVNYQCRYGMSFHQALNVLLRDGGIPRLYRGLTFALIQAPMARFVSTAANDGVQSLLSNLSWTNEWGPGRTTFVASIVVGLGRIFLMRKFPIPSPLHNSHLFREISFYFLVSY